MNSFSNIDKLRAFVAPKITDLTTPLDNNRKSDLYKGGDIYGIYRYLEIIGAPTTLNTSGQRSRNFRPSPPINNDAASIQPVIAALRMRQNSIFQMLWNNWTQI